MTKTYRELAVWKRIDDKGAVKFRCFEDMDSHAFCVQSADFYRLPLRVDVSAHFDRQFVELFIEIEPMERCEWFASVEKAIAAHEKKFHSMAQDIAALEKKNDGKRAK